MNKYTVKAYDVRNDITEDVGEGFTKAEVDAMIEGCKCVGYYETKPKVIGMKCYLDDRSKILYTVIKEA